MQQRVLMLNDRRINGYTIHENSPIGTIILYAGQIAPEGYIPCDGRELSRRLYADLFNAIGTTYGKGDGLYTFNIPDARDRVPQGASARHPVGKKLEAGLPNIEGGFDFASATGVSSNIAGNNSVFTGALYKYNTGKRRVITISDNSYDGGGLGFDASRFNAIYGNSETVQMPAFTTNYYIKAKRVKPEAEKTPQKEVIPTEEYIRDLVLKTTPVGELKYFPEKKFVYGYRYADGSVFLPEVYPDFFEFWKIHFEKECGYDNNGYPRLPDYSGRYIRGVEKGEQSFRKERESLPNITGTLNAQGAHNNGTATGAFNVTSRGYHGAGSSGGSAYINGVDFDAGLSNSIYGRNKNKPSSVIVNNVNSFIYIKVI